MTRTTKISKGQLVQARKNNMDVNSKTNYLGTEISFKPSLFYWEILWGRENWFVYTPSRKQSVAISGNELFIVQQ